MLSSSLQSQVIYMLWSRKKLWGSDRLDNLLLAASTLSWWVWIDGGLKQILPHWLELPLSFIVYFNTHWCWVPKMHNLMMMITNIVASVWELQFNVFDECDWWQLKGSWMLEHIMENNFVLGIFEFLSAKPFCVQDSIILKLGFVKGLHLDEDTIVIMNINTAHIVLISRLVASARSITPGNPTHNSVLSSEFSFFLLPLPMSDFSFRVSFLHLRHYMHASRRCSFQFTKWDWFWGKKGGRKRERRALTHCCDMWIR